MRILRIIVREWIISQRPSPSAETTILILTNAKHRLDIVFKLLLLLHGLRIDLPVIIVLLLLSSLLLALLLTLLLSLLLPLAFDVLLLQQKQKIRLLELEGFITDAISIMTSPGL